MILYTKSVHNTHRKSSIGVVSEQTIMWIREICQSGGQIKALTENSWDVASQSLYGMWCHLLVMLQPDNLGQQDTGCFDTCLQNVSIFIQKTFFYVNSDAYFISIHTFLAGKQ